MGTTAATRIPRLPIVSRFGPYNEVERFTLDNRSGMERQTEWAHDDIAGLARLVDDLRSDASFLETLADQVKELLSDAIDDDRNRDAREARRLEDEEA